MIACMNNNILALATVFFYLLTLIFLRADLMQLAGHPKALLHLLLSTLVFSVLCVTALQAVVLSMQDSLLRNKRASGIITLLPPLEVVEKLLFQMLLIGLVLLTLLLATSLWSFYPILISSFWQKACLSLFAWLVFIILLIGRHYFGWRGQPAIRWTIGGVFLVIAAYLGSAVL